MKNFASSNQLQTSIWNKESSNLSGTHLRKGVSVEMWLGSLSLNVSLSTYAEIVALKDIDSPRRLLEFHSKLNSQCLAELSQYSFASKDLCISPWYVFHCISCISLTWTRWAWAAGLFNCGTDIPAPGIARLWDPPACRVLEPGRHLSLEFYTAIQQTLITSPTSLSWPAQPSCKCLIAAETYL